MMVKDDLKDFLSKKGKSVLFVHTTEDVKRISALKEDLANGLCIIIPTSPEALFALNELKLPYKIPEDYYTPEEYYHDAQNIEEKIIDLVSNIDRILQEYYPEIKQSGLRPAFYHMYPFNRAIFPLADAYFKVKKIIEKEKPDSIGLLAEGEGIKSEYGLKDWLLWGPGENIFQKVLGAYQTALPIHFFLNSKKSASDAFLEKHYWQGLFKKWLGAHPRLYLFLKLLKTDKQAALMNIFFSFRLTPLLMLNNGYDWKWCYQELHKKGYFIFGQLDDSFENWLREDAEDFQLSMDILKSLEHSSSFRKSIKEEGIDFYPLLKDKIVLFLTKTVPASLSAYKKTTELIKKQGIKSLLFSVNPTAISKSIAYAAQTSGIPVIGWQHGDMNYKPSYSIALNDLLTCDLFLSWGQGSGENRMAVARELNNRASKITGSSSLDTLLSLPPQNRKNVLEKIGVKNAAEPVIVYATTMYYLSNAYTFSFPPWSDNHIYDTQKKIIGRLALCKGTKIIKLHPNLFYALPALDTYCRSFTQHHMRTVRDEMDAPLLFSIADAIVIDMPTTTLLQAIACKKPIFCLTKHLKLESQAIEMLKKRVVLADDPKLLTMELESFLQSGKYKADLHSSEFLENYGTGLSCQAAQKAVAAVDELIRGQK